MTNQFYHKRIEVISIGPDGHRNQRSVYEVTGTSGGRAGFKGYGSTLEDAVVDAMRAEANADMEDKS